MSTAAINGTTLRYDEVGSGPVCLVLHGGLGSTSRSTGSPTGAATGCGWCP